MSISYLLVTLGLGVFALAIWAMFWAIDSGQYDDLESQGASIFEDESGAGPGNRENENAADSGPFC